MRSNRRLIYPLSFALMALALTACATPGQPRFPTVPLTEADRAPAEAVALPPVVQQLLDDPAAALPEPATTGAEERAFLIAQVIGPILTFSLRQERRGQKETQRADGVVAKVDAHIAAVAPPRRRWWPWSQ